MHSPRLLPQPELVREVGGVVPASRWGVVTVSDTGAGIDTGTLSRIF